MDNALLGPTKTVDSAKYYQQAVFLNNQVNIS